MRIFVGSDFHADHRENMDWLRQISSEDYRQDILVVAGDVANGLALFETVMALFANRFSKVLYVPGNHDLWVDEKGQGTSFDKFSRIQEVCTALGISMQPLALNNTLIVPLLGWYDYSFGEPGSILKQAWMDYRRCDWDGASDEEVSQFFDAANPTLDTGYYSSVLSFSHFLPRIDLMPERMPEKYRFLYPVLGSSRLESRIAALGAHTHIYGHSHLNRRLVRDGRTYINNAFGYPSERDIAARMLVHVADV